MRALRCSGGRGFPKTGARTVKYPVVSRISLVSDWAFVIRPFAADRAVLTNRIGSTPDVGHVPSRRGGGAGTHSTKGGAMFGGGRVSIEWLGDKKTNRLRFNARAQGGTSGARIGSVSGQRGFTTTMASRVARRCGPSLVRVPLGIWSSYWWASRNRFGEAKMGIGTLARR